MSTTPRPKGRRREDTGHRYPGTSLTLLYHVERPGSANAYAVMACDCGREKELAVRHVKSGRTRNCADRTAHPHPNAVARPSIGTVHSRLRYVRGPARDLPCVFCGQAGDSQWSYLHGASEPLIQESGPEAGQVYSTDLADYAPLCRSHHGSFDRKRASLAPKQARLGEFVALAGLLSQTITDPEDPRLSIGGGA